MTAYLHALQTAVPENAYTQDHALACMQRWLADPRMRRLAAPVYKQSGIDTRHSVLPDFKPGASPLLFHEDETGALIEPSTGMRNRHFEGAYPALARAAVERAFAAAPHLGPEDVTHVITVSCTGFTNPGPDLHLTRTFGLNPCVQRYHLGFMGCYAALPALRMADQFCRANPDAVALLLCVELCSLHLQVKPTADALLANALFADGAAAALVSARPLPKSWNGWAIDGFSTRLLPEGARDMAWTIGDRGFDMILSSYVPRLLGLKARSLVTAMLAEHDLALADIREWAIHPGGRAILDRIEESLDLPSNALECAREILRDFGNMSSVTVLFVLKRMLESRRGSSETPTLALAFGPGLTVEMALLRPLFAPTTASAAACAGRTHAE